MLSAEATNTNFIFFGFTLSGLEPTIYRTMHCTSSCLNHATINGFNYFIKLKHVGLVQSGHHYHLIECNMFILVLNNNHSLTTSTISVLSWWSVLIVEETRVPTENNRFVVSHWQILSHNLLSSKFPHEWKSDSHTGKLLTTQLLVTFKIKQCLLLFTYSYIPT
jgi:hypothetical protein